MTKSISILGSTGSIGVQTLEVAREHNIQVKALSANKSTEKIFSQIKEFMPSLVSMGDEQSASELEGLIKKSGFKTEVMWGDAGNRAVASVEGVDMTVAAMVGVAGLSPVVEALKKGRDIALANKETLVAAGSIVTSLAKRNNACIYPVDSEHSAIWQCLRDFDTADISRIFLTASGGPFRGKSREELLNAGVDMALSHPTWDMGGKITIDSATLMNKGLEVIEAYWLFGTERSDIVVVVHPQSIIHSMVELNDGSVMAQMGFPDMKMPIRLALMNKKRVKGSYKPFDPFTANKLTFERPDTKTFRCLELAYIALDKGGSMPGVMNCANEMAVSLFLDKKISFLDIPAVVEKTMEAHERENFIPSPELEDIFRLDVWARNYVNKQSIR